MLLTTEEVKRRILDYLQEQVELSDGTDIRPFTVDAIHAAVDADSYSVVTKALEALEEEGNLKSVGVHMKVFAPSTDRGRRLVRRVTSSSHRLGSALGFAFVAMMMLYVVQSMFSIWQPSAGDASAAAAYASGFEQALGLAAIIALPAAWALQVAWTKYKKWAVSETAVHDEMVQFSKFVIWIATAIVAVYVAWARYAGQPVLPLAVLSILGGAFSVSWFYHRIRRDNQSTQDLPLDPQN